MSPAACTGSAGLDALSRRLLAAAPELRVAVAGPAEREAIFRLRAEHIAAAGWAALPARREADGHDARALQIGAWRYGTLVGAIRLVLPGAPLPVEEAFGLRIAPSGAVAEAGRLVIAAAHRGDPAHRAWGALFARAWLTLREHDLSVFAGAAARPMIDRLRALGLPFEILGPAQAHWGELRHPVRLDPEHGTPRWYSPSGQ
jgi:Acetyltransferase (GNAT) domain